jgi:hypothetical protein
MDLRFLFDIIGENPDGIRWVSTIPVRTATGMGALLLGAILWLLGWLKVTQQAQYVLDRPLSTSSTGDSEQRLGGER